MGKTYCASDWHGCPWAWNSVKDFLGPDDKLFFLGDVTDRGEGPRHDGGWSDLKEMLADERIVFLKGNHEDMLAKAIANSNYYTIVALCIRNGGQLTLNAALADPDRFEVAQKILALPLYATYRAPNGNYIYMSHSGSTDITDDHALIWDRAEYLTETNYTGYDFVIHGHTPAPYLKEDILECRKFYPESDFNPLPEVEPGAYWYRLWRCDVDCLTVATNQIVLLDLDTWEEHIFDAPRKRA